MKHVLPLLAIVVLAGCAQPQVVASTPGQVIIAFDPAVSSIGQATAMAQEQCGGRGRDARLVQQSSQSGSYTLAPTVAGYRELVFDCVDRADRR